MKCEWVRGAILSCLVEDAEQRNVPTVFKRFRYFPPTTLLARIFSFYFSAELLFQLLVYFHFALVARKGYSDPHFGLVSAGRARAIDGERQEKTLWLSNTRRGAFFGGYRRTSSNNERQKLRRQFTVINSLSICWYNRAIVSMNNSNPECT